MPLVKSYYRLNEELKTLKYESVEENDLSAFVSAIAVDVLSRDPKLVADTASGKIGKGALEDAIIHSTEKNRHSFGFYQDELIKRVMDFMFGYGPLQDLIEDENISDIDGTSFNEFSIKRNGKRETIKIAFRNKKTFDTFCKLMIIRNGGIINENDSHCRVVDEKYRLRINVSIPPRNITGPSISIRKHRINSYNMDDLERMGMIDKISKEILLKAAVSDKSMILCGKGASGKTTLLRAFINALPEMERVLVLESDSEIYPDKKYCIAQRIKKANEGGREITLKNLVADGLTMSLDTYCIGEIVGDEALEFIRAAFSGHRCLATTHALSAEDAMNRLLTLARSRISGESETVINTMIGAGVDMVVYLKDFKVRKILNVRKYDPNEGKYETEIIWERREA